MEDVTTLSESLISLLPTGGFAIAACIVWWVLCRYVFLRDEHNAWLEMVSDENRSYTSIDDEIAALSRQLTITKSGSPADRLFISGLLIVGLLAVVLLLYLYLKQFLQ